MHPAQATEQPPQWQPAPFCSARNEPADMGQFIFHIEHRDWGLVEKLRTPTGQPQRPARIKEHGMQNQSHPVLDASHLTTALLPTTEVERAVGAAALTLEPMKVDVENVAAILEQSYVVCDSESIDSFP